MHACIYVYTHTDDSIHIINVNPRWIDNFLPPDIRSESVRSYTHARTQTLHTYMFAGVYE